MPTVQIDLVNDNFTRNFNLKKYISTNLHKTKIIIVAFHSINELKTAGKKIKAAEGRAKNAHCGGRRESNNSRGPLYQLKARRQLKVLNI